MADIEYVKATARAYVELLETRQKGGLPEDELRGIYSELLERLMSCYPYAFHFIARNAELMTD